MSDLQVHDACHTPLTMPLLTTAGVERRAGPRGTACTVRALMRLMTTSFGICARTLDPSQWWVGMGGWGQPDL